jgi:hypothetical protein
MSYQWQKLYSAIESLIGNGPLQERLAYAAQALLRLSTPLAPEFRTHLKEEFQSIWRELTRIPAEGNEGSIRATTSAMSNEEAKKISNRIFRLFCEVAKLDAVEEHEHQMR